MPEKNKGSGNHNPMPTTGGWRHFKGGFAAKAVPNAKFTGWCKDIEGHLYDLCSTQQADQYTRTTEKIAIYVAKEYSHGSDHGRSARGSSK
jgi:hypothetical protein